MTRPRRSAEVPLSAALHAADILSNQLQWPPYQGQDDEDARNFERCMKTGIALYQAYQKAGGREDVRDDIKALRAALRRTKA